MGYWWPLLVAASALGTWLALRYARARSLLDAPGERRSHAVPTPRGGGVAMMVVLVATGAIMASSQASLTAFWIAFSLGLLLVGGIGWWDDHRPLSAWLRLAVHLLAGGVLSVGVLLAGGGWIAAVACGLLAVILVNVWNFMDGINGIATTQFVLVAGAAWLLWGEGVAPLALACVASGLGFLPFNFPRARIFLGDVGSGGMGFALAALYGLAVLVGNAAPEAGLVPVSAFVVDAGLTLGRRIWRGEAWWTAHVQHTYQVWARELRQHWPVTLGFATWTVAGAASVAWLDSATPSFMGAFAVAWYTSGALLWWFLQNRYALRRLPHAVDSRDG